MDKKTNWGEQRKHSIISGTIGVVALTATNRIFQLYLSNSCNKIMCDQATDYNLLINYVFTAYWIIGFLGISLGIYYLSTETRKITERIIIQKKNHQFQQQLKMQKRMVDGLVHDLRTPVTSVMGYMELIKSGAVKYQSDEYWDFIETVEKCSSRIEDMTEEILESVRLMSGKAQLNLEPVDMNTMISEIISEIKPILLHKDQRLSVSMEKGIKTRLDRMKITQAILNILTNASKFSPEGSVISLEVNEEGENIEFNLVDHGIGLRKEDIPKLFTTFPDIEVEGDYDRVGLGLSTVKSAVDLHGGQVYAESDGLDKGTRFCIRIPKR